MAGISGGSLPRRGAEPLAGHLGKRVSEQVSVLMRDELSLAQLGLSRKGMQADAGIGLLEVAR